MKRAGAWQAVLAVVLVLLSAGVYYIHYLIFHDAHHIFIYLIGDIAFVFLEVLLVTIIFDRLLALREKKAILKKLNMVIGMFFNELGTELLKKCSRFDLQASSVTRHLVVGKDWSKKEFFLVKKNLAAHESQVDSKRGNIEDVKQYLMGKRQFLLNLLQNPNLLEHEAFTNLLWAVFHLTDELSHRDDFNKLPDPDFRHLSGDIRRVYHQLILQWLAYMKHLKEDYPYLFSLAMRTNPFDASASVELR